MRRPDTSFIVQWEIDIDVDLDAGPESCEWRAAEEARQAQRSMDTTANVFTVIPVRNGKRVLEAAVEIDLDDDGVPPRDEMVRRIRELFYGPKISRESMLERVEAIVMAGPKPL